MKAEDLERRIKFRQNERNFEYFAALCRDKTTVFISLFPSFNDLWFWTRIPSICTVRAFMASTSLESWKASTKGKVWTTLIAGAFQTQTLRDHWLYTATFMHETLSNFRSFRKLPKETE